MSSGRFGLDFRHLPDTLLAPGTGASFGGMGFDSLVRWLKVRITATGLVAGIGYDVFIVSMPEIDVGFAGFTGGTDMYINGPYAADVLTHELGHALGLQHARAVEADAEMLGPLDLREQDSEYGHAFDIMGCGRGPSAHFNVKYKLDLGWLDASEAATVSTSGVFRVYAHDSRPSGPSGTSTASGGGLKGIRVPVGAPGSTHAYWIEYRAGLPGALVQFQGYLGGSQPENPRRRAIWLLHAEAGRGNGGDTSVWLLRPGVEARDPRGLAVIRVLSIHPGDAEEGGWAEVQVTLPGTAWTRKKSRTSPARSPSGPFFDSRMRGRDWLGREAAIASPYDIGRGGGRINLRDVGWL